jgi:hypothetical protein
MCYRRVRHSCNRRPRHTPDIHTYIHTHISIYMRIYLYLYNVNICIHARRGVGRIYYRNALLNHSFSACAARRVRRSCNRRPKHTPDTYTYTYLLSIYTHTLYIIYTHHVNICAHARRGEVRYLHCFLIHPCSYCFDSCVCNMPYRRVSRSCKRRLRHTPDRH